MTKILSRILIAGVVLGFAATASAQLSSQAVTISAKVNAKCTVGLQDSAITIAPWAGLDESPTPVAGNFRFTCTKGTTLQVEATAGDNAPADTFNRSMKNAAGDLLGYKLSVGAAANPDLAIATATPVPGSAQGKAIEWAVPLFVSPSNNDPPVGDYVDHVTVTFWMP